MKLFSDKNAGLKNMLRKSGSEFKFDQFAIKKSILETIEDQQLTFATERVQNIKRKSFFRQHQLASLTAAILLFIASSSVAISQSNLANPGSRFYIIDQLEEQVLLNLPLPENQKVNLEARMVEERNKELDYIIEKQDQNNIKLDAVKESQDLLNSAIDNARTGKENSTQQGKTEQTEKYNKALNRLENLAVEQEKRVENLRKLEKNAEAQKELDKYLESIKQAKERAKINPN